ncbi:MAG: NAD-dependent epimerase/dehydratase family protein [Saprospiraceae bacterium]|nr:NAD-dependent epimerase/dehydratase family protein [Saprospiraceae bacterium]
MPQTHIVLGASGAVGKAVIQALQNRKLDVIAVARSINRDDIPCRKADLLIPKQAMAAVQGGTHVYLCVGLPYNKAVWKRDFPILMMNVIEACKKGGARLIYLDNIYMYGPAPLAIPFDETHPQQAATQKGKARKKTTDLLLAAVQKAEIKALVGRAADFYGPGAVNSPFYMSFLDRMLQGKAPQSIAISGVKHTYAYVPDIGRALVALALEESTYGQVWHLPVGEVITVEEMLDYYNATLGTDFKVSFLPAWMRKLLSLFIPTLKEVGEMNYQYETEYRMSFEKFRRQFPNFEVTSYKKGVEETVKYFQANTGYIV